MKYLKKHQWEEQKYINFRASLSCSFLKRSTQTNISKTLVLIIKRVNFTPTWGSIKLISALWVLSGITRTSSTFEWAPLIPVFPTHLKQITCCERDLNVRQTLKEKMWKEKKSLSKLPADCISYSLNRRCEIEQHNFLFLYFGTQAKTYSIKYLP